MTLTEAVEAVNGFNDEMDETDGKLLSAHIERVMGACPSIETLESVVSFYKARLNELVCKTIPDLLHESGQSSCVLKTGETVKLETVWNVSVPKNEDGSNNYAALSAWLESNQYGAIIKDSLEFEKGELSEDVLHELGDRGLNFSRSSFIHPTSLKKVIKEHCELGGAYPPETAAKITIFERAKIK